MNQKLALYIADHEEGVKTCLHLIGPWLVTFLNIEFCFNIDFFSTLNSH